MEKCKIVVFSISPPPKLNKGSIANDSDFLWVNIKEHCLEDSQTLAKLFISSQNFPNFIILKFREIKKDSLYSPERCLLKEQGPKSETFV